MVTLNTKAAYRLVTKSKQTTHVMLLLSRALVCVALVSLLVGASSVSVERWRVFELTLSGPSTGNPFVDVALRADFTINGRVVSPEGFYDGGGVYKIRFSPDTVGTWTYTTTSTEKSLDGHMGNVTCTPALEGNHGPANVKSKKAFAYADGTSYFSVGTTCYAWIHQEDWVINNTLATLKDAPFNKMRMTVFPKWYVYNRNEPLYYPYEGTPPNTWDFTKFHIPFWQNLERRISQLDDLGIIAEPIIFHPYDYGHWGFDRMGAYNDDLYLRYLIARVASFKNVMWSMANEWDLVKSKTLADWDRFFEILQAYDPYHRERSIHNGRQYYNHSLPWITHISLQGHTVSQLDYIRKTYLPKPITWDEVEYEGDVPEGWGNLTPQQMTQRFWLGNGNGVYVGHGETYLHNTTTPEGEVLWWSKGNVLRGQSPLRIAFFKKFMESQKVKFDDLDTMQLSGETAFMQYATGSYYLIYWYETASTVTLTLPGTKTYQVSAIDYYNMTVTSLKSASPGTFKVTAPNPYYILRLQN